MKFDIYKDSRENLKFALKFAGGTIAVLLLVICFLVLELINISHRIEYVLIPPGIKKPLYIGNEAVDRDYLVAAGVYIANLLEEYSPDTIDKNYEKAVQFIAPEIRPKFTADYEILKKQVIKNKITQILYIYNISVEYFKTRKDIAKELKGIVLSPVRGEIDIYGRIIRTIGNSSSVLFNKYAVIKLQYLIRYGMFQISGIDVKFIEQKENKKGE